jgi:hypothetical protein
MARLYAWSAVSRKKEKGTLVGVCKVPHGCAFGFETFSSTGSQQEDGLSVLLG